MPEILPRFFRYQQAREAERNVARAVLEGATLPVKTSAGGTVAGDPRRLRGVPAIGRGVSARYPEHGRVTRSCGRTGDGGSGPLVARRARRVRRVRLPVRALLPARTSGAASVASHAAASAGGPASETTPEERKRFRRWWLEESGLSALELYEIAVGLSVPD